MDEDVALLVVTAVNVHVLVHVHVPVRAGTSLYKKERG